GHNKVGSFFETPALIIRALFQILVEAFRQVKLRGVEILGISSCAESRAEVLCGLLSLAFLLFAGFCFRTSRVTETLMFLVFSFAFALLASPSSVSATRHSGHTPACCHTFHHRLDFPEALYQRIDFRNVNT